MTTARSGIKAFGLTLIQPPSAAGKFYFSDGTGALRSRGRAVLGSGRFETFSDLRDIGELAALLEAVRPGQVMLWGTATVNSGVIAPQDADTPGSLTRSPDVFARRGAVAVIAFDYDPPAGGPLLDREGYASFLGSAGFDGDLLIRESTSALIFKGDEMLKGPGGIRALGLVSPAVAVTPVLDRIMLRGWLAGFGHIRISESGAALVRGPVDRAMANSAQPDFAPGGALLGEGLEQRRPPWTLHAGDRRALDYGAFRRGFHPSEVRKYDALVARAKLAARPEMEDVTAAWLAARREDRIEAAMRADGCDRETAMARVGTAAADRRLMAARGGGSLGGDFVLHVQMPREGVVKVTVAQVLADRTRFHGRRIREPMEPGYADGQTTGKLLLDGNRPVAVAWAHGQKTFTLSKSTRSTAARNGRPS